MMTGDELSIFTVAEVACFVRNSEVSFNEVFRTLTEISKN
jgi:roadblock/LC7 domain-containing protein